MPKIHHNLKLNTGENVALLPFYIPKSNRLKVVIIGGGYAGMAALTVLSRYASNIDITLIDPLEKHIKITHLHETFRYPLSDLQVSFKDIEKRFDCRHIRASVTLDEKMLCQWQADNYLVINEEVINFDYLLVTTGCGSKEVNPSGNVLTLQDFMTSAGSELLTTPSIKENSTEQSISIIGGGATGIQFLFEINQFLNRKKINYKLNLIHSHDNVLGQFPAGFNAHIQKRMQDLNINFYANTVFQEQQTDKIVLQEKQSGKQIELPSTLSLLFLGKQQQHKLTANSFGQIIVKQKTLPNIFTAGDCSYYNSFGSNALTAQSAVRKGKLSARNILRHSGILQLLEPYLHRDIGYVVSLGSNDAVGWLASKNNIITGIPALSIKELVEAQYDLLLIGVDTYLI